MVVKKTRSRFVDWKDCGLGLKGKVSVGTECQSLDIQNTKDPTRCETVIENEQ